MSLDSDIRLLGSVQLFRGFQVDHLRLLAFGAEKRFFRKEARIYRQGTYSDGGYVLMSGTVQLVSGLNDTLITTHRRGSLLAEMALISQTHHAASALVVEDCEALKLPRPLFLRMLEEYPQLAVVLQQRIGASIGEFVGQLDRIRAKLEHANNLVKRPAPGGS
ncbi:MAG: cyclic nucleotide-binding domain-containing protein [Pseudomonadota bacterium]